MIQSTEELVKIIGVAIFLIELLLLLWLIIKGKQLTSVVKWISFIALIIGPILLVFLGNFHVFDNSKTVNSCSSCHVMKPMVVDMKEKESMTLAARHYKNNWINKNQCYGCHKDYGLNGSIKAKMDGYRHLMRYITNTYEEPIKYKGYFSNSNCGSCHYEKKNFLKVDMHNPILSRLKSDDISCMNCHGKAHPSRLERTPGSPEYDKLTSERNYIEEVNITKKKAQEIKKFTSQLIQSK
jgi:nitrate/TMAO reductase-like tetraheme cytochrome c subunit